MKLSVITVNYNNCKGLEKTIKSVVSQSLSCGLDFEYIIIDGGSADGSAELIQQYSASLAFAVSEKDSGIFHAMNKGVGHASGDYVIFMNSGDCFHTSDVLRVVMPQLQGDDFYIGDMLWQRHDKKKVLRSPSEVTAARIVQRPLSHPATFMRTQLLRERPYREDCPILADREQMLHELVFNNRSYKRIDILVSDYEADGFSGKMEQSGKYGAEWERVLREAFPPRVLLSLLGCSPLDSKIRVALEMERPSTRYSKLLRYSFQAFVSSLFGRDR